MRGVTNYVEEDTDQTYREIIEFTNQILGIKEKDQKEVYVGLRGDKPRDFFN